MRPEAIVNFTCKPGIRKVKSRHSSEKNRMGKKVGISR